MLSWVSRSWFWWAGRTRDPDLALRVFSSTTVSVSANILGPTNYQWITHIVKSLYLIFQVKVEKNMRIIYLESCSFKYALHIIFLYFAILWRRRRRHPASVWTKGSNIYKVSPFHPNLSWALVARKSQNKAGSFSSALTTAKSEMSFS